MWVSLVVVLEPLWQLGNDGGCVETANDEPVARAERSGRIGCVLRAVVAEPLHRMWRVLGSKARPFLARAHLVRSCRLASPSKRLSVFNTYSLD